MTQDITGRVYVELYRMTVDFQFLPGERLNEAVLAKSLGVSRTPLRTALARLAAEGLLTYSIGNGFSCCTLDEQQIRDLYEFRIALEQTAVRLAIDRATEEELDQLVAFGAGGKWNGTA